MVKGTEVTRLEALEKATQVVEKLADPPKNDRGYIRDGWKAPTFAERTESILTIAAFLLGTEDEDL